MSAKADTANMAGKTCLVTGATSGIGRAVARALAAQGAELLLTARDRRKAEDTVAWIQSTTGNSAVHYLLADFSDLGQVRALARACQERAPRLHVLVNNAGTFFNTRHATPYGVEETFLVNHLAPFLLTNLLLDLLRGSAPARIVNVASEAHRYATLDFDDLGFERGYFGFKAYARSKLANILFTEELARRLDRRLVTANAVHPGHVASDMWRTNFPVIGPALKWVMGLFALSPEQGAEPVVYVATSPAVEGVTGQYFAGQAPVAPSTRSQDEGLARQLWEVSVDLTGGTTLRPSSAAAEPPAS